MLGSIALTLFLVFLNGFFVAAEFAIVKVRASQIELRIREGSFLASLARHMLQHLDAYLSASQLGITLASLGLGAVGEAVVKDMMIDLLGAMGIVLQEATMEGIAITIALSIITVLHIVVGEQAPKTFAIKRSEDVTLLVALPMRIFFIVFRPLVWALNWMSNGMLRVLGMQSTHEHDVHSPEELRYLIKESGTRGALEMSEQELIENVFEFTETTAGQVMVPRNKIAGLELTMSSAELIDHVMEEGYSRMPVYRGNIDTIVGIVYAKDLLTLMHHRDLIILQDILHPPYVVTEDVKIKKLLRDMQQNRVHMAIVLNEFGGTAGLLTLEDIMEELVGNIQDEYDEEAPHVEHTAPNTFDLQASVHIAEANDLLPRPLPETDEYETVGGLINAVAGRIPAAGDLVRLDDYDCLILEATPRRVELVRLTVRP
jgi:CBS domain containing-hemolysin-like protein